MQPSNSEASKSGASKSEAKHNLDYGKQYDFIANLPLFSHLSPKEIETFTTLMQEIDFKIGEEIVKEGDFVDSFFLILKGEAKVIQNKIINGTNTTEAVIVATLKEGEAIGLDQVGFFSPHGKRTATVVAVTEITTLRMDIASFNAFLKKNANFDKKLKKMTEDILKLHFIKQICPFYHLNNENIYELVQQIEEIQLPEATTIFKQGDFAENCYLIRSGEVEVFISQKNNKEKHLATLKASELLGEAALLTGSLRNATARTKTTCYLLVIKRSQLFELLKSSIDFTESITGFMVNRFRPVVCDDINVLHHPVGDKHYKVMLHNTKIHQYYPLTKEAWFIWQQLDGLQTVQDLTIAFYKKFKIFAPEMIYNLLYSWVETGFVKLPPKNMEPTVDTNVSFWKRMIDNIRNVSTKEYSITHTDQLLTKAYRNGIFLFYTWPLQVLFLLIIVSGLINFFMSYSQIEKNLHHANFSLFFF